MHRSMRLLAALAALAGAMVLAADKPVVGTWEAFSDSPGGEQYKWTLVVKQGDGKLSGTISGGPGQYPLLDPNMEGDTFTCKITIEEQTYTIQVKVTGSKFEGIWKSPASQGAIKGTKQS